jgi:hypothetical protein
MLVGGAQFVNGFIGYETWIVPGDWFQGLVLVIIGLVFSWGYVLMRKGDQEWDSYLAIGSLLSVGCWVSRIGWNGHLLSSSSRVCGCSQSRYLERTSQ